MYFVKVGSEKIDHAFIGRLHSLPKERTPLSCKRCRYMTSQMIYLYNQYEASSSYAKHCLGLYQVNPSLATVAAMPYVWENVSGFFLLCSCLEVTQKNIDLL